jgi:hypothetical protein
MHNALFHFPRHGRRLLVLSLLGTLAVPAAGAASPLLQPHSPLPLSPAGSSWPGQKLVAGHGATGDQFALSVALDGDVAVAGAPYASVGGEALAGTAYVFTRVDGVWQEAAELHADDGVAGDYFGWSVAVRGDVIMVGTSPYTFGGNFGAGAVYVFVRDGMQWNPVQKLMADGGTAADGFGSAIALDDDTALVGAWHASNYQGAAYVFTASAGHWIQSQVLTASDGVATDVFANALALDGDQALVGAPYATVDGNEYQGAAYAFVRSDGVWSETGKLSAADPGPGAYFGYSVALDDSHALVGVYGANAGRGAGALFARDADGWQPVQLLEADDGAVGDQFGMAVALADGVAVVGAEYADVDGNGDQGGAWVWTDSGSGDWIPAGKLVAADGSAADHFGHVLATSAGTVLAGVYEDDQLRGSAWVFRRPANDIVFADGFDGP